MDRLHEGICHDPTNMNNKMLENVQDARERRKLHHEW